MNRLRLGTRGSRLALAQSQMVADSLHTAHHGSVQVELIVFKTTGDQIVDRPLAEIGGKGLFTRELEVALKRGDIDLAVHSLKDVPVTQPLVDVTDLVIAAIPTRADPRDALVCSIARNIDELPAGARVGTGSIRRRCQLLAQRPDLNIDPVRGNIDTRLRKQHMGEFDALVLAVAGLERAMLWNSAEMFTIAADQMLPAAGQGALGLQCRLGDSSTIDLLSVLNNPDDHFCVSLERQVVAALDGDCHSPIAALAQIQGAAVQLNVVVGARDGGPVIVTAKASGSKDDPGIVIRAVLAELREKNVGALLAVN